MTVPDQDTVNRLSVSFEDLPLVAELVASDLMVGDAVLLCGDLGAGKTEFARHVIRSLLDDQAAEVPSPTFPIVQVYEAGSLTIGHFDFYRLSGPDELEETGFVEIAGTGVVLAEWPEKVGEVFGENVLEVTIAEAGPAMQRHFTFSGRGRFATAALRLSELFRFLKANADTPSHFNCLHGDASSRRYFRLVERNRTALVMDSPAMPDGPRIYNGRSYGEVVHLAENVRPFVAIDGALAKAGLSVPVIYASDVTNGFLLIEDLGDGVFGRLLAGGSDQRQLWSRAVDVLVELRNCEVQGDLPVGESKERFSLSRFDREALHTETELLLQWYWPAVTGSACPDEALQSFRAAWAHAFTVLDEQPEGWVLRDFHSPNLIWLPDREGIGKIGVIDFQDAVVGHPAYDLVSLLQDARVEVDPALEDDLVGYYFERAGLDPGAPDGRSFKAAYALLGAQRNTKILGIFARLAARDGKTQYLQHIPRIWGYLERNLQAVTMKSPAEWYERYLPAQYRRMPSNW